jgi:phage shock protein E
MRYIIDVREPEEYARSHVEGAINVPPTSLLAGAPELARVPKDAELVLYCLSGARSRSAMPYLRELGYDNLVNGINKDHVQAKFMS